jgi:hypothetical protein
METPCPVTGSAGDDDNAAAAAAELMLSRYRCLLSTAC